VLDEIPNDISVVAGTITSVFQTPLAHINVLSVNRGTPNMGFAGAFDDPDLRALEGKWVELDVQPFDWTIKEITQAEADSWWADHQPAPLTVPTIDESVTAPTDVTAMINTANPLKDEIEHNITIFGSKGTN